METPNFFAIIPANVRYSDITANAKLLYGEITALANKTGCCYASNGYFAELYGVENRQIMRWINQLEEYGFITREIYSSKGNQRFISIVTKKTLPSDKKDTHNNTSIITDNNTENIIIIKEQEELKKIEDNSIIDNVDDLRRFLNKGKLQEEFYYKIGTEDTYERITSDFFIFCDENGRQMKKKTIEAKFRAYLKPSWEKDEDRKEMILAYNRKKAKDGQGHLIIPTEQEIENQRKEVNQSYFLGQEVEKNLSEEEKKEFEKIEEDVINTLSKIVRGRKLNPSIIKGAYYSRIGGILKK